MAEAGGKKILYVATLDVTIKSFLLPHMKALKEAGYHVEAACRKGAHASFIEKEGFEVHHVNFSRRFYHWANLAALLELLRILRRNRYDILHTHTPVASFVSRIAARLAGVPCIIYTVHGAHFHEHGGRLTNAFYRALEKTAGPFTDAFITINSYDHEKISAMFPGKKVFYIKGVGLDIKKFKREDIKPSAVANLRKEFGINGGERVIGMVAEMNPGKRHIDFLRAASLVSAKMDNIKYLMVGDGPLMKDIKAVATELNVAKNCIFAGYRNDMPEVFALMDIFVFPSIREGLPVSVMEAMSMKIPVVAADIRGSRDLIIDGETGILVPVKAPEAIAQAVLRLLDNPAEGEKFGRNALKKIENEFEEGIIVKRLLAAYRALAG